MDFNESFENIKSKATDAAQGAARKAKLLAFIAKTNINILSEQDKQKKAYTELGKLYYRDYVTGEEPDEAEYLPWCEKLTESVKTVEEMKTAMEQAKAEDAAYSKDDAPVDAKDFSEVDEQTSAQDAPAEEAGEPQPAVELSAETASADEEKPEA